MLSFEPGKGLGRRAQKIDVIRGSQGFAEKRCHRIGLVDYFRFIAPIEEQIDEAHVGRIHGIPAGGQLGAVEVS